MRSYDCPSCGAAVKFQSSVAVFAVCPYCRSMVVRHDVNVEHLGKMAELPPDLSPLQLGTRGQFDDLAFTLVGRVRLKWPGGSWTEWCAVFSDNRWGWVAEAQGLYMVSFEYSLPENFPARRELQPGVTLAIAGQAFTVVDIKNTNCLGGEGELPFIARPGREGTTIDFSGKDQAFASLEYSDDGARLFLGRYARFDGLQFASLRNVPGWSDEAIEPARGQTQALACPQCGAAVNLRAAGFTMSATCGSCASLIDTSDANLELIQRAHSAQGVEPLLPLGARGELLGVKYEVIGFQQRKDEYAQWSEYLLFNPWQGFAWLTTFQGHWVFVTMLIDRPRTQKDGETERAFHDGGRYRLFARGGADTTYVLGEFYWKARVGEHTHLSDFVNPPHLLSRELYPDLSEVTWSAGQYVEPAVVQAAFTPTQPLPERVGIFMNQPNPYAIRWKKMRGWAALFIVLFVAIELASARRAERARVFQGNFVFDRLTPQTVATEPFDIPGRPQAVEFASQASVDNAWLELAIDLVNAETQQKTSFVQGIEHYHGFEDGESWREGNRTPKKILPAVAPGKYYLTINASADPAVPTMPYRVTVVRDVMVWSSFWIGLITLLAYPLYVLFRKYSFEVARWSESDFSPYSTGGDDDDD